MQIPMSEAEKAAISEYAEGIGEKPVTWARAVLLKAAQKKAASGERGSRTRTARRPDPSGSL